MKPASSRRDVVLRCLNVGGKPRYDLPAVHLGAYAGYEICWRPAPAAVIHHEKERVYHLPDSEFVLVGVGRNHCISISVDTEGRPVGMYVNINLAPREQPDGWSWEDLELDLKVVAGCDGCWQAILLDLEEYERAALPAGYRDLALREVTSVLEAVNARRFPFLTPPEPWLGFDPPVP